MPEITSRLTNALADRYRLERHLGEGGMATVYLAHDLKHDRKVALKILRPELAAILGGERFLNEIRVTANLQHPNILPLYDSGEADSFLYYVMPHVEGETLREKMDREKQLGVEETLELARREMASKVEGLGNILQDLSSCKARICTEAEAQLLELTLTLAEVVVRHEVSCGADTVRETLQAALEMAGENSGLKVRLHPEDLENIMEFLPQLEQRLGAATQLELEGDLAISQGGCLVETDSGMIDARLEEQLEALRQQLQRTSELRRQGA